MRIEQIIGEQISARRQEMKLTQEALGHKLSELLGKRWERQAVWAAEQGKRSFPAVELVAFAHVLSTTVDQLLQPDPAGAAIQMPSGREISWGVDAEMTGLLSSLQEDVDDLHEDISDLSAIARELRQGLARAISIARSDE